MTEYKKLIISNNPEIYKKYNGKTEVLYMDGAAPAEVYSKAKNMLEDGARLIRAKIKKPCSPYATVSLFWPNEKIPSKGNLREVENALSEAMTYSKHHAKSDISQITGFTARFFNYWHSRIEIYD